MFSSVHQARQSERFVNLHCSLCEKLRSHTSSRSPERTKLGEHIQKREILQGCTKQHIVVVAFQSALRSTEDMERGSFDSCSASIYKRLAYYQGTLSILDMILFFVRIGLGINMTGSSTTATTSTSNQNHIGTGIALDAIGSVILCMIGVCALILSTCRSTAQCCKYCR
jgi:hypothetical protein